MIGKGVGLGAGCVVQANAILEGSTILGAQNFIGYGAVIGATPQDFAFRRRRRVKCVSETATRFGVRDHPSW